MIHDTNGAEYQLEDPEPRRACLVMVCLSAAAWIVVGAVVVAVVR